MSVLRIPKLCLVVLIGASGSGKSTFAAQNFGPFETISSDFCRGLVSDDENDQAATSEAFDVLRFIAGKRLAAGRLTVIDATNVQKEARAPLVALAREHDVLPIAIVLDIPEAVSQARNESRADRAFGPHVVRRHQQLLRKSLRGLGREGFRTVHVLKGADEVDAATIVRERLYNDLTDRTGPFDIIGDVHGCRSELETLLARLGYSLIRDDAGRPVDAVHPDGRTVIFVGDLIDRGPDVVGVLRLAMGMTAAGHALAVPGNHEAKLIRALDGAKVQTSHGLAGTLDSLAAEPQEFVHQVREWCRSLVSHLVLDGGRLVVAHAGLKEAYHGRASGRVRAFALYGDTTGETDEYGLPVRLPWANQYRGRALVAYGHVPTPELEWVNNTLCLDTGCVFGGHLSALRYPERETVQVPAEQVWYEPVRPLRTPERPPDELSIDDVAGKRIVETRSRGKLTIRAENAAGALEVMSRFALHPRLLPYLPPTMAPVATSSIEGYLEHPREAFAEYAGWGVAEVICEEKHMGSRAIVSVHRSTNERDGAVYTRTGRSFLPGEATQALLARVARAVGVAGLWNELATDWLLLDAELLPWSLKAEALLKSQYAAIGAAARLAMPAAVAALSQASDRGVPVSDLRARTLVRRANADAFTAAYQPYCWPTDGLDGVQLAPFQLLASDGAVHHGRDHGWHLELADRLVAADPALFRTTRRLLVSTGDAESCEAGVDWWLQLTGDGGEGMVVKPLGNLTKNARGLVQPGLKVRGREYLRIIYGPDYTNPEHLGRLRDRRLNHKRALALSEYALGLESLERHVEGEPLWRVHEAVFAILALESEAVDPRL